MRVRIQHERRIELAFEEHRHLDVRRWKLAESVFGKPVQGLKILSDGGIVLPTNVKSLRTGYSGLKCTFTLFPRVRLTGTAVWFKTQAGKK